MYKLHHPKANTEGLYDQMEGRGLSQNEAKHKAEINNAEYLGAKHREI
jgi:hypothetical protein